MGADLLDFAVPKIADIITGRKNFTTAAEIVGRQTLKKISVVVAGKRVQAESFQEKLQNKPVVREEAFFTNISH